MDKYVPICNECVCSYHIWINALPICNEYVRTYQTNTYQFATNTCVLNNKYVCTYLPYKDKYIPICNK